ncbi:MAG: hypothetical protein L0226_01795 [Acidobacteria bacterium]|nr:hypothetical protein [Acidobacteriota bacterium]
MESRELPEMDEQMMIQYLLGELSAISQTHFEEALFNDPGCYAQLMVIEDKLIDDYLCGQLSPEIRSVFEQNFLISERRREKLTIARTLHKTLREFSESQPERSDTLNLPAWQTVRRRMHVFIHRPSFVLLCISLLSIVTWLAVEINSLRSRQLSDRSEVAAVRQVDQSQSRDQHSIPSSSSSQISQPSPSVSVSLPPARALESSSGSSERIRGDSAIFTHRLKPGRNRSIGEPQGERERLASFAIPSGKRAVRFKLELAQTPSFAAEFSSFRVKLMTAGGNLTDLPGRARLIRSDAGQDVVIEVSTRLLRRGDYVLMLFGVSQSGESEGINDYYFAVLSRRVEN